MFTYQVSSGISLTINLKNSWACQGSQMVMDLLWEGMYQGTHVWLV
jgi:hypothetical protein